jgi:hypothetical protein
MVQAHDAAEVDQGAKVNRSGVSGFFTWCGAAIPHVVASAHVSS